MWSRKELKKKGRGIIRKHYWRAVAVSFIIAFLAGNYNGTFTAVFSYDPSREITSVIQENLVFDVHGVRERELVDLLLSGLEEQSRDAEEFIRNSPYTRGVFATVFNYSMATGSVFTGIAVMLLKPIVKGRWLSLLAAGAGAALLFFWWLLVRNILQVGNCRFYLEAETYRNTGGNRIFFLYKIRKVWKTARVILRKFLYQYLWSFTIVGGWIKGYSYMMVPYLAAENPNITGREAIRISRSMMQGNKWDAFLLDCSFLGWSLLSFFTFGLVNIFYANPYKAAARAELYLKLRRLALENEAEYAYVFNDKYLDCPPSEEVLRAALRRAASMEERPDWRELEAEAQKVPLDVLEEYPFALFTVPGGEKRWHLGIDYHCTYGLTGLILLFFVFSFTGWCWEVGLHLVQKGTFVNRGVFHGPWLPIYGSGGVLVLVLLKKLRDRPVATFFMTMALCGTVEYVTSWFLEVTHDGVRWWDYSGYFLNLNGRICAEGLLIFGIGGCAFIYILAPLIMNGVIRKIPVKVRALLCVALISLFVSDMVYTSGHPHVGAGISKEVSEAVWEEGGKVCASE